MDKMTSYLKMMVLVALSFVNIIIIIIRLFKKLSIYSFVWSPSDSQQSRAAALIPDYDSTSREDSEQNIITGTEDRGQRSPPTPTVTQFLICNNRRRAEFSFDAKQLNYEYSCRIHVKDSIFASKMKSSHILYNV